MQVAAARVPQILLGLALLVGAAICHSDTAPPSTPSVTEKTRYIVQAGTLAAAREMVAKVGGAVVQELEVINSVSAELTEVQADRLRRLESVKLFKDRALLTSGLFSSSQSGLWDWSSQVYTDGTAVDGNARTYESNYTKLVGADAVQNAGITGKDVTIAVLDTGLWYSGTDDLRRRVLATIDVVNGASTPVTSDPFGHGTHVASIAAGTFGIAPGANLVIVRAFNGQGAGRYTDVIAGINWIIANRLKYKIRVLNLSFGAPPQSNYWDDPL